MALAVALVLLVLGTVAFHFLSPWWFTPIASNWQRMDDTVNLTFLAYAKQFGQIHGLIFVFFIMAVAAAEAAVGLAIFISPSLNCAPAC